MVIGIAAHNSARLASFGCKDQASTEARNAVSHFPNMLPWSMSAVGRYLMRNHRRALVMLGTAQAGS